MKNLINNWVGIILLFSFTACSAKLQNTKVEHVKIYGNCGMCKTAIETAGTIKKVALVNWDKETKIASLSYDSISTNKNEILKRIALAGYDSDHFLSPDDTYSKLPKCCQYDRAKKDNSAEKEKHGRKIPEMNHEAAQEELSEVQGNIETIEEVKNPLEQVFHHYFALKEGLVKSSPETTSSHAKALLAELNSLEKDKLPENIQPIWMKTAIALKKDAEAIASARDLETQREHFMRLSENMHSLIVVTEMDNPVYYQHCPMANNGKGAYWLSKDKAIKNPYYGSQMLSCGSTKETLGK